MKLLMISTDFRVFDEGSDAARRMADYGTLVDQLHVVVFTTCRSKAREVRLANNVWAYPTHSRWRWLRLYDAIRVARRIVKAVREPRTGWIITTQDPFETALVGLYIRRLVHAPLQIQVHTDILSPYFTRRVRDRIRLFLARRILPRADTVRVVSERIRASLVRARLVKKDRIYVVPVHVDMTALMEAQPRFDVHERHPQFRYVLVMASRLTSEKDIGAALRALATVRQSEPETGLVIVGDGPERERLRRSAYEYGVADAVVFESWTDDLASYYKTADIFLLTSRYEGYGRTLIEAGASGAPIVTTDVGLVGSVLRDEHELLVCPVGDADCVASRVLRLLRDRNLARQVSARAYVAVQQHVPTREGYLALYHEALAHAVTGRFEADPKTSIMGQ